jgi:cell division septation protein DedD
MTRPKLVVVNTDLDEQPRNWRDGRRYRFDLSMGRVVFYISSLVLALCFMFTLGIFVGRGVAVVGPDDVSFKGSLLRFLGLAQPPGQPVAKAAETWEDPKKMLESLKYYEDLTHKGGVPIAVAPKPTEAAPEVPVVEPGKEPAKEPAKRGVAAPRLQAEKQPSAPQADKPQRAELAGEQFTLLVASLKETEAQALIEKLKAKGYSPRIEEMDLGTVKWDRILLGSFPSREAAIKFADEFNSKENLEALVTSNQN